MTAVLTEPSTTVDAIASAAKRPFALARHSLALAWRNLVKTMRNPEQLLDVTLQPIIFTAMFGFLLGGALAGDTAAYLQTLVPALAVMLTLFASIQSGVNFSSDLKTGLFDRFRSMPIGRSAPLIGAVLGDGIRYVVTIVVLIGFSSILGFRIETDPLSALAGCLLAIGLGFALSWVFLLLGAVMKEPGSVQGVAFIVIFPLTFGTNMLTPVDTMPGWLQAWMNVNPAVHAMDAARGLMIGGPVAGPVTATLLWTAGIIAVFAPLAVRAYRRRT
ncbi:ABC transporter permease [Glycomyces harbinensis]|uniref:Transport permease protein n=1 Tax=Glycomyces harbinensis TaxID=58114 RepID=A0A1G7CEM1_9ACTN|nr:ABC transporter permease [Glycomyces harbinensis]SDE37778.1 oleandomycin transport system permease protein [Glycomyces harbinensis]